MQDEINGEIEELRSNCIALEEQVKLLVQTELKLRRTQTELEKAKKEIEDYNRTLEHKVEERTMNLKRVNSELVSFTYMASHDLQEPLRKIDTFGHRLKENYFDVLDDHGRDYLDRIQNASTRMQTLIKELLAYSRVTTKAAPFVEVNLLQIVNEVLSDLEIQIEKTSGLVEVGSLPNIEADSTQMRQLFQNLIGNALKFHKENESPIIKIYSSISDEASNKCELVIADNGIGIENKNIPRLFGLFQCLHERDKYEGNGIGLAICNKIVEQHNGNITVESKPGVGTKFIIMLPVKQIIQ
ncbi:MAG: hypothetical protein EHM28_09455 [Spirochaetaceae bacterium]|nr:MAG: hypothetical protein EHM28_09455 [Spirochaetaceae bacterium]